MRIEPVSGSASINLISAPNRPPGFSVPTHALRGYKSGYSETTHENTSVTYVFDFFLFIGGAKRIRTPDPRITNSEILGVSHTRVATVKAPGADS
jgi:hypothetical protein